MQLRTFILLTAWLTANDVTEDERGNALQIADAACCVILYGGGKTMDINRQTIRGFKPKSQSIS